MDCVTIEIVRKPDQQWGMQVSGDGPCYVEHVQVWYFYKDKC